MRYRHGHPFQAGVGRLFAAPRAPEASTLLGSGRRPEAAQAPGIREAWHWQSIFRSCCSCPLYTQDPLPQGTRDPGDLSAVTPQWLPEGRATPGLQGGPPAAAPGHPAPGIRIFQCPLGVEPGWFWGILGLRPESLHCRASSEGEDIFFIVPTSAGFNATDATSSQGGERGKESCFETRVSLSV